MPIQDYPAEPILLVDDEIEVIQGTRFTLVSNGINNVLDCGDSRQVAPLLAQRDIDVILLDLSMPHVSGKKLLREITQDYPQIPVIIVTGANDIDTAIDCMKNGAFDYMVKPVEEARLVSGVRHAIETRRLERENARLKKRVLSSELERSECFSSIVTNHPAMRSLFQYTETVAPTDRAVLITGESGVGKELLARALHRASGRSGAFVPINVAGLDDTLFSDTLFGHARGAFAGAEQERAGRIGQAENGTLFLDEIGDLSPPSQIKLLRLIQEFEYFPLGSDTPKRAHARVVAATNQNLQSLQKEGRFRKDLYYRLQTHQIQLPPLRERLSDLPFLLEHFLERSARALRKKKPTLPRGAIDLLSVYSFPGNVRELEAMVFDAVSHHESRLLSLHSFKAHIARNRPEALGHVKQPLAQTEISFASFESLPTLRQAPRLLIAEALRRSNGNQSVAAQILGISPSGLSKALKRAELQQIKN